MITGQKRLPGALTPPALVSPVRAVVLFAIAVGIVGLFLNSL